MEHLPNNPWTYQLECLTENKQISLSVATKYLNIELKNHCACVWILTDVDFTDDGEGRVGGEGLYWLLLFHC